MCHCTFVIANKEFFPLLLLLLLLLICIFGLVLFLAHCIKVATTVDQLDSQSNRLIEQLRIFLRRRCNEYVINGFTHDKRTELIHEIASH